MKEYHKIRTIYERNAATKFRNVLEGAFSIPEFAYLQNNAWLFTEKINGMSVRIKWQPNNSLPITFGGKTDNAQIPALLYEALVKLVNYGEFINIFGDGTDVCLYGEGYGCFSSNTGILLADGTTKTISCIVNNKLRVNVLTYNFEKNIIESSEILNYFKYANDELIKIRLEKTRKGGRGRYNQIVCTRQHLIYTDEGYIEAEKIKVGSHVISLQRDLSFIQEQALYGILLGDGSINNKFTISISHSTKQQEYITFLKLLFNNIYICERNYISGYGSNCVRLVMSNKELFLQFVNNCMVKNKKKITINWIKKLTPLALAFWYMDDGSIDNKHRKNQVARIATQGFSYEELNIIQAVLFDKYQIKGSRNKGSKEGQFYLQFSVEESNIFFLMVAPYIIKSLKYKLPEYLQEIPCVLSVFDSNFLYESKALKPLLVKQVTAVSNKRIKTDYVYDIKTKNKNYFIGSGLLVHNSKIQKGGGNYHQDQSFVLFDIKIGVWFLSRDHIEEIAKQLKIDIVPVIGEGTLLEAVEKTKKGFNSQWGDFLAEGIVARPVIELKTRSGERLITKIKYKDFAHE